MGWRLYCRRLQGKEVPTGDISFYKKLTFLTVSKEEAYQRQPSQLPASDPRHRNSLPGQQTLTFAPVYLSSNDGNWCGREPHRTILIEGLPEIHSDAAMLALLEESLLDSDLQVQRIELNERARAGSVTFTSGFKAWEVLRSLIRSKKFKRVSIDPNGRLFKSLSELQSKNDEKNLETSRDESRNSRREGSSRDDSRREDIRREESRRVEYYHRDEYSRRDNSRREDQQGRPDCNPFVPCLTIPFQEFDVLPFRNRPQDIINAVFAGKFASFIGAEAGSSSWHIHFGREIDVIEADRVLQQDTLRFEGREFYFERWKLVKDGRPWTLPSPVKPKQLVPVIDSLKIDKISLTPLPDNQEPSLKGLISHLPKFVKKRTINEDTIKSSPDKRSKTENNESKSSESPVVEEANSTDQLEQNNLAKETDNVKPAETSSKTRVINDVKQELNPLKPETALKDIKKVKQNSSAKSSVDASPKKQRGRRKQVITQSSSMEIDVGENDPRFEATLASGCARAEGFFRLEAAVKRRVKFPGILEAFSMSPAFNTTAASSTSRSSRAQNRRPLLTTPTAALDLFKVSPLQSAQKLVSLRNSSIHSYGLVIMEPAEPGDLIIEYVGELVRGSVANIRELAYEREHRGEGIASSYLFRLDDVMVLDATKKGSLARFVNHSCDPNCVAKTITLNGSKRIVMYAKKPLKPGDEITYDYKFPLEKDPAKRVKCLCGTQLCRKYLN